MILHGHEHQPSITVTQRWSYPPRGHERAFFPVVSAGTVHHPPAKRRLLLAGMAKFMGHFMSECATPRAASRTFIYAGFTQPDRSS